MNIRTRRQLLTVLGGLAGGLAGCAGESVESSRSVSETHRPTVPDDNAAVDPPMLRRRSTATQPPLRLRGDEAPQPADDAAHRLERTTNEVIDTAATADRLVSTGTDGVGDVDVGDDDTGDESELSTFIAATDFETETLYLETIRIEQCYRLSLCFVSWQDADIRTAYGRRLRPYDEQCVADRTVAESRLFRLPVALDADAINGLGTSIRSGRCPRPAETDENESAAGNRTTDGSGASTGGSV
ncbi:MAG: hypothetical protein ABEH60_00445 [Halonotius sp.]